MKSLKIAVISLSLFMCSFINGAQAVDVKRVVSPGGVEAWLVEDHSNPIVTLNLTFRGGAALDPVGQEGLANMVSALIDEGAGDLGSLSFQKTLNDLSIHLGFSAYKESFSGNLQTLSVNQERAFELLKLAITAPRFDEEPVERIRSQIQASLRRSESNPGTIASKALYAKIFPNHPYGRPSQGTPETVALIGKTHMAQFVASRFARNNLIIGVVGDITPEYLGIKLDQVFGTLPAQASPWQITEITPVLDGSTVVIENNNPQSSIIFAETGLKRDDPDYYAATVMNRIFGGGGLSGRLYEEIREKRGLAYSVYSYLSPYDHSALMAGRAGTANERAGETIKVLREEWRKMSEQGVTEAELNDAKTYLTGSFALRFTGSSKIASILVGMQRSNLGIDYIDKRNSLIEAVTLADVNRVAKKLLNPDRLTITVVGHPEGL